MTDRKSDLPLFSTDSGGPEASSEAQLRLRPDSSLKAAINAWGAYLQESGKSIHTMKAFTADLELLAKFVGAGQDINAIGTHDLRNFLEWLLNRRGIPCSPKTYARRVTSIKSFFRWLKDLGILSSDPATSIPQRSVLSPLPEVLTKDELEAVLNAANAMRAAKRPDARPYTLAALLLHTGIKKSECLSIHLNHIALHSPEGPFLFVRYSDPSKRYRERKLPLTEEWVSAYHEYLAQIAPAERVFPYSPRRLEYMLEDLGNAAQIGKHLSFNMCRWTSALMDYIGGDEKNKIRQKMGLSKIQWREVGIKLDRLAAKVESQLHP